MEFTERPQAWFRKLRSLVEEDPADLEESRPTLREARTLDRPSGIGNALDNIERAPSRTHAPVATHAWLSWCAISTTSYFVVLSILVACVLQLNADTLTYSLDDAYIHLALARNWLRWNSVGISPGQIAVASSSPAWTAIVAAAVQVFGANEALPLLLNVIASVATLGVFWWGWKELRVSARAPRNKWWWLVAAALPILLNLPALTLSGMETTLSIGLVLAFGVTLLRAHSGRGTVIASCVLSSVLPLVRLESVFVIAGAALILWQRRQLRRAALILLCAGIPLIALSLVLHAQSGLFLPNSIVTKGLPASWSTFLIKCQYTLYGLLMNPLVTLVLLWSLTLRRGQSRALRDGFLLCFVVAVLHVVLSSVSGTLALDRYESYFLGLALLVFLASDGTAIRKALAVRAKRPILFAWERSLAFFGVFEKAVLLGVVVFGCNDVFLQQYQTARFIRQQFPEADVVVNDIGLVALRAGGNVTDLVGLGSTDVLHAVRDSGEYTQLGHEAVDPILDRNGADLIAIYPDWFSQRLYGAWKPVAAWSLARHQVTAGGRTVVFFARDREKAAVLRDRLLSFESHLPAGVRVRYAGRDFSADTDLSAL